jgi:hypothetical protein
MARAKWVDARVDELLPRVPYFHVVFTLPHELNPIILHNKRKLYTLLFKSSSDTVKQVGSQRLGGAQMGFTAVLHTWSQKLMDHPHVHMIVPGGGLSPDHTQWVPTPENYLLPTKGLSAVYRGKFLEALERMHGELEFPEVIKKFADPGCFKNLLRKAVQNDWVVYAKQPFSGPKQVLNYLGNYTHRIAISNFRLVKHEDGVVHFLYRDRKTNESKVMALPALEFLRRFLLHVLPPKFVRLRHYGLLGSRLKNTNLKTCRTILLPESLAVSTPSPVATQAEPSPEQQKDPSDWMQWLKEKTGVDLKKCKACKTGNMHRARTLQPTVRASLAHKFWTYSKNQPPASPPRLDTS